ncbi:MAG: aromatic ring-hydroxylating dioxygenase subunit alpha [Proteobacteria bacterium]|nr:aromatic ring-hydroxylating dioxygenase subunit alpha [Pseudomonadota bacterium]
MVTVGASSSSKSLKDSWYPVVLSSEVKDKPVGVRLLNTEIVLWRTRDGVAAFRDLCIHRGTRLSLGKTDGEQLTCPYHGWCYDKDGAVVRIPAIPEDRKIPEQARVEKFRCTERYGLVYVCLGTPTTPIYEVSEFEQDRFATHILGPVHWNIGAARSFENFIDEAHLPWVHPGILGNVENVPLIPSREVKESDNGFYFEYHSECADRVNKSKMTSNLLTYDVVLPYSLYHENVTPSGERVLDLFYCTPVSENESIRFMLVARNFALDEPSETFAKFTLSVWEQDRIIVESQRPTEVPIDLGAEVHIHGPDGPSVLYRRMLGEMGF